MNFCHFGRLFSLFLELARNRLIFSENNKKCGLHRVIYINTVYFFLKNAISIKLYFLNFLPQEFRNSHIGCLVPSKPILTVCKQNGPKIEQSSIFYWNVDIYVPFLKNNAYLFFPFCRFIQWNEIVLLMLVVVHLYFSLKRNLIASKKIFVSNQYEFFRKIRVHQGHRYETIVNFLLRYFKNVSIKLFQILFQFITDFKN